MEKREAPPIAPHAPEAPASLPPPPASAAPAVILTAVLALAAGVAGTLAVVTRTADWQRLAENALSAGLWMLAGALALLLLGAPLAFLALLRLLGKLRGSVAAAIAAGGEAARAWDAGDRQRAIEAAERIPKELAAWWARGAVRRWAAAVAVALLAALGPLLSALLVLRQTALLEAQNELIEGQTRRLDQQTITAEATRRNAALNPDLLEILRQVSRLPLGEGRSVTPVPPELAAQVAAFLAIAEPYLYLRPTSVVPGPPPEGGQTLSRRAPPAFVLVSPGRPLSPERGVMLAALARRRVDMEYLTRADATFRQADLHHADLEGANLRGTNLQAAWLGGANLRGASLASADLRGANLQDADLTRADLRGTNLLAADLGGANLRSADLASANLQIAGLQNADLAGANLRSADLRVADLTNADLQDVNLEGADLTSVNLTRANLQDVTLEGAYLRPAPTGEPSPSGAVDPPRPALPKGWENGPPDGWALEFREATRVPQRLPERFQLVRRTKSP